VERKGRKGAKDAEKSRNVKRQALVEASAEWGDTAAKATERKRS
jgi:hypothetical protein